MAILGPFIFLEMEFMSIPERGGGGGVLELGVFFLKKAPKDFI